MRIVKGITLACACFVFGNTLAQDAASAGRGKTVYEQHCLACHQADASGVPGLAPPLIEGMFVSGDKTRLIHVVLNGLQGVEIKGEHYANPMPGFAYLTDAEVADVLTYIRSNFKNKGDAVTEAEVKQARTAKPQTH